MRSNRNCVQIARTLLWLLLWLSLCRVVKLDSLLLYRFKLDVGNPHELCPKSNITCGNGQRHYLCRSDKKAATNCINFKFMVLNAMEKASFLNAHNGIRNKVAEDFNIANMNLVYWSKELSLMAIIFLRQCLIEKDTCKLVGEKAVSVNQNYIFRTNPLRYRWPGRVVRQWYLEMGFNVHSWQDFMNQRKSGKMENFTQLIWPPLEFIGCGAVKMLGGAFIACYYHPPYEEDKLETAVSYGKPCTNCQMDRPTCSKTFSALCGVDFPYPGAVNIPQLNVYLFLMCMQLIFLASEFSTNIF